jgi:adenine deaminase
METTDIKRFNMMARLQEIGNKIIRQKQPRRQSDECSKAAINPKRSLKFSSVKLHDPTMTQHTQRPLATMIAQGAGREPADLVIKNVRLYDLITGALTPTDIAICGDRIVGTYAEYHGVREIDGKGRIAVPGFIDTHFHVESSLLTPLEYDRCVLPHGITTAIWDPHEIANVLGNDGIRYALECASATIMDLRVMLSSCVPATDLETSGATLDMADLAAFRSHPKVLGLAEFMNFPGVIYTASGVMDKLEAWQDGHIDGHAPLLSGTALNAYLSARIRTDHEATTPEEALEKLKKGMAILIREGSVSKDLHALTPIISAETSTFLAFCTDDRNPLDVAEGGHIDFVIRTAISLGAPALHVYRVATVSAARLFGLTDRGLVAPGYRADIVLLEGELAECAVSTVISAGRLVTSQLFETRTPVPPVGLSSMKAKQVSAGDFKAKHTGENTPVIGVEPGKIITQYLKRTLPASGIDTAQDVIKVAVIERHGKNGNIAVSSVHGFGLKRGAIASSVGHDSHNITVVGADDTDIATAANRLTALQGGFVVVEGGKVIAELALPVAGLMSLLDFEGVRARLLPLRAAAKGLGCTLAEPFLQVAFLPLPVIPHLKITDIGLVDVDQFKLID